LSASSKPPSQIRTESVLSFEPFRSQVSLQGVAADLLLTFDQEAEVDRWATGRKEVLDGLECGHVVALVVGAPSCVEMAVADLGLEGG